MNTEAKARLAEIVRKARGKRSLREFARLADVSAPTVQGWENGDYTSETGSLLRIASIAGFSLEELLNYLNGKPFIQKEPIDQILEHIELMPLEKVAKVAKAAVGRLASAADQTDQLTPH